MSRLVTILTVAGICLATAAPVGQAATPAGPASSASKCTVAGYTSKHGITAYHQNPHLTFVRRLNVAAHSVKKDITWSVPASNPLTAHASKSGGAHGDSAWIWRAVKHHFGLPVAVGGAHTPRLAKSGGVFAVRNDTSKPKHEIEFNGLTRFSGRYFTTRCGDLNPRGTGRVVRENGAWVTFSKVGGVGIVQCGIPKGTDAIAKAALKHCS